MKKTVIQRPFGKKKIFQRPQFRPNSTSTLKKSFNRFLFPDVTLESLGQVSLLLATPPGKASIFVVMDVVPADIPPLLGMDVLDRESSIADTVAYRLTRSSVR